MKHIANLPGALTHIEDMDIQPNAVDLALDKVFWIRQKTFRLGKDSKQHRGSTEMFVSNRTTEPPAWHLKPGSYEVIFKNIVNVPEGKAGFVITRSTLNRNGCFLTSGLYDSGYNGVMAAVLHVTTELAIFEPGARLGQFLLYDAETVGMYEGDYGLDSKHDQKYSNTEPVVELKVDGEIDIAEEEAYIQDTANTGC